MTRRWMSMAAAVALVLAIPITAMAQTEPITVDTPYPGISVDPGRTASFPLDIGSDAPRLLDLSTTRLPDGWTAAFRGGGSVITTVNVSPDGSPDVRLDVSVPAGAVDGSYDIGVQATDGIATATAVFTVSVAGGASGAVTLTPDFAGLRGTADANFVFRVQVSNDTASDVSLELSATGPSGWLVEAKPSAQSQASSLTVGSGDSQQVNVTANPPVDVVAGTYDLTVTATGDGIEVKAPLAVQIIGDYALTLTTPDQRLNADVTAGEADTVQLVVVNTGTAPLVGVELTATPPRDWIVDFDPAVIDQLAPGDVIDVTATVTPSSEAIAGDYDIGFRAAIDQAQDTIDIRATVSPTALWGLIGVGVIALTLGGLSLVFRRFGRR